MNLGILLDAALGVLAVMILFSLAAAAINEFISDWLLQLRGRNLTKAIEGLLATKDLQALTDDRAHGDPMDATAPQGDTTPSVSPKEKADRFFNDPEICALMDGKRRPSAIEPRRYAVTVLKLLGERDKLIQHAEEELRAARAAILASLPEGAGHAAVEHALEAAAARAAAFRTTFDRKVAALEAEFNEAMDRATGWYLRRVRLVLFVIGLVMAVGANVDLLYYADRLMTQASVRDKATIYARMLGDGWIAELDLADATAAGAATPAANTASADGIAPQDLMAQVRKESELLVEMLEGLDVRVGWDCRPLAQGETRTFADDWGGCAPNSTYGVPSPSKIIGWLIIAFGVTLGAQFWFDLFKRMVKLRTAGFVAGKNPAGGDRTPPERA